MRSEDVLREFFVSFQIALGKLLERDWKSVDLEELKVVAAVDAAYRDDLMSVAAIRWSVEENKPIDQSSFICEAPYPYIPGLLFLREAPPMLRALKKLKDDWQLLLVDGHGLLHPRKTGLAVILGFILEKPTLGIAKSLLVGFEAEGKEFGEVRINDRALGYWFKFPGSRKFYASPGYLIDVKQIPRLIEKLGNKYPDALTHADKLSKNLLRRAH